MDPTRWPHAPGHRRMKLIAGLLIAAALAFASGCAQTDWIDRTLVTETVSGVWAGSMDTPDGQQSAVNVAVRLELQQQGPRVSGVIELFGGGFGGRTPRGSTPIEGSVAGDVFRFKDSRGTVVAELAVSGDEMRGQGTAAGGRPVTLSLRRVDASPPPTSPTR
jgi:hypothetical protein